MRCAISPLFLLASLTAGAIALPATEANAQAGALQHAAPPSWWVGMQDPTLQVMLHGENLAALEPQIDYPGVSLDGVTRVENPNYLFVNLRISPDARPGTLQISLSDGNRSVSQDLPLQAREPGSRERRGFGPEDVIYLITPDRFANGDPSNDKVAGLTDGLARSEPYGRHGGDLQGIIDHLDYLADMGYTQLWLNPVLTNDQPDGSYHGYAQTDLFNVDPRFGSNAIYKELSSQARDRGIGLIQDIVLNHIGSEHWWMADLPSSSWINYGGRFKPTSHHRETLHDPHGVAADRRRFQDGWFVETMPDLNQRDPQLARYLIQHTLWWIEYAGLTGLRIDTFPYPDREFTGRWAQAILAEYPQLSVVGEEWSLNPALVAYWQRGANRHTPIASGIPNMMDFPLHDALIRTFKAEKEAWNSGLNTLYQALANDFQYADPYQLVTFGDNHDMSRLFTLLGEDEARWRMAMTVLMTTRGIPQLFYGTEILMSNPGTESHGVIRSDFPGGWPGDDRSAFTGKGLTVQEREAQTFTKKLLNWRKSSAAVQHGRLVHYTPEDGVYVYFRTSGADKVMVVINRVPEPRSLDLERFREHLGASSQARDVLNEQTIGLDQSLAVTGQTALLLELL